MSCPRDMAKFVSAEKNIEEGVGNAKSDKKILQLIYRSDHPPFCTQNIPNNQTRFFSVHKRKSAHVNFFHTL